MRSSPMSFKESHSGSSLAPVKRGETYHLQIEDRGREGDAIGYIDGFVIFVADATLDGWVTVEIQEVHETFAVATVADESNAQS
jgi:predicted RNA-binding protein with TRAM domain